MGSFGKTATRYSDYRTVTNEYGTMVIDYSVPSFDDIAFFTYQPVTNRDNERKKEDDDDNKKNKGGKEDKRNK